jgi:trehalose/maltose hydrolase-like predicted phosphorylase
LGIDEEFFESVLVPQVMIYGFLGFTPQPGGLRIDPHLPKDWQALTITRIAVQDSVIDVTARPDGVEINCRAGSTKPLGVVLAPAQWQLALTDAAGHGTTQTTTHTVKTSGDRIPLTLQTGQQAKFTRR